MVQLQQDCPQQDCPVFGEEYNLLNSLLSKLSSPSHSEKKVAVKGLLIVLKDKKSIQDFVGQKAGIISLLINALNDPVLMNDTEVQECILAILSKLSVLESNRTLIGDNSKALELFVDYLKKGTMLTRFNATGAIITLCESDSTRKKIAKLNPVGPLVQNLNEDDVELKRITTQGILQLCTEDDQSEDVVFKGAVPPLLELVKREVLVGESLAVLALVTKHSEAAKQILQLDGVATLKDIIKFNGNERDKKNAVSILHLLCVKHNMDIEDPGDETSLSDAISAFKESGSDRASKRLRKSLENLSRSLGTD